MSQRSRIATLTLTVLALSALSGCTTGSQERAERAAKEERREQRAENSQAEARCMAAVNRSVYGGEVRGLRVTSSGPADGGTRVDLTGKGKNWRCVVADDGRILDLSGG